MTLDALHLAAREGHTTMIQVRLERTKMNDMIVFEGSYPQLLYRSTQNAHSPVA